MRAGFYIGLMSGTSMDGVDAALVEFSDDQLRLIEYLETPYEQHLRSSLEDLVRVEHASLSDFGRLHVELGAAFAAAARAVMEKCALSPLEITAIGSHGQTVLHKPDATPPYSIQLGDASVIAFQTRVTTVADFRSKDIAAGGQGAPLVPAFHQFAFGGQNTGAHAVLNLGGIANLTIFIQPDIVSGFDCGPGNTLMDGWVRRCQGLAYDAGGSWGRSGEVDRKLLEALMGDEYFARQGPKSSGRDYFNMTWLAAHLDRRDGSTAEVDVQATLAELTAAVVADALRRRAPGVRQLAVCGGGIRNAFLMERLAALMPQVLIRSTSELGVPPQAVEACAFAWLAARRLSNECGNVPAVTGAPKPLVLGAIYHPD